MESNAEAAPAAGRPPHQLRARDAPRSTPGRSLQAGRGVRPDAGPM